VREHGQLLGGISMVALVSSQAFLIALVLLVAGSAKFGSGFGRHYADETALGALAGTRAVLVWRLVAAVEVLVGLAILAFSSSAVPSAVAAALLLGATAYGAWGAHNAPGRPCGCFGGASKRTSSLRSILRAAALSITAGLAAASGTSWTAGFTQLWPIPIVALEAAALLYLAPETRVVRAWIEQRRSGLPSCLFSDIPLDVTLRALTRSAPWSQFHALLTSGRPTDEWRQDCWQYLSYPATVEEKMVEAVFAIHLPPSKGLVWAALVDGASQEVVARAGSDPLPVGWTGEGGRA
jgi:hypothetical protein